MSIAVRIAGFEVDDRHLRWIISPHYVYGAGDKNILLGQEDLEFALWLKCELRELLAVGRHVIGDDPNPFLMHQVSWLSGGVPKVEHAFVHKSAKALFERAAV